MSSIIWGTRYLVDSNNHSDAASRFRHSLGVSGSCCRYVLKVMEMVPSPTMVFVLQSTQISLSRVIGKGKDIDPCVSAIGNGAWGRIAHSVPYTYFAGSNVSLFRLKKSLFVKNGGGVGTRADRDADFHWRQHRSEFNKKWNIRCIDMK
eukprot:jgi/Botrbrau1/18796/Bobra.0820s0002.1